LYCNPLLAANTISTSRESAGDPSCIDTEFDARLEADIRNFEAKVDSVSSISTERKTEMNTQW